MNNIPYKFDGLRSAADGLRLLSIIIAVLLIMAAAARILLPGFDSTTYRQMQPDVVGAITLGTLAIMQLLFMSLFTGAITLLIERERNDRVTQALLVRLIRQSEAHETNTPAEKK